MELRNETDLAPTGDVGHRGLDQGVVELDVTVTELETHRDPLDKVAQLTQDVRREERPVLR